MKVVIRVLIGELTLRNSEVEAVEVSQALGAHTRCRVEFTRDRAQETSFEDLLKAPVRVTVQEDEGDPREIFQGHVVNGSQAHLLHFGARFILEAVSPSLRHEHRDTVYFPQSTLSSIAGQLGATLAGPLRRDAAPFDHVQWGETEFAFLERLADDAGCFLVTTGPAVEIRSGFQDRGWELTWGETLLEVTARAAPANHGLTGASYDVAAKSTHWHAGVRQAPASTGGAGTLTAAVSELANGFAGGGDPRVSEQLARDASHGDFKTTLRAESERALGAAVTVDAVSSKPGLMAGDLVELIEGKDFLLPTRGKLGLVQVTHVFRDQHYINRFTATPWRGYTAPQRPPRRVLPGPVTAEVTSNGEDPLGMGRVKVSYRWQAGVMTNWARVVVPHAGNGRGFMFLPEIGDEVLVDFERGDPEHPYVIGSLWNGKDLAPGYEAGNTAKRLITRSGNTIQCIDEDGKERIEIFTPDGKCFVQLANNGSSPVVTIQSAGDIALEAKHQIRLKCESLQQDISGNAARKVGGDDSASIGKNATIKAGMDLAMEGLNTTVKAGLNLVSVAGAVNNMAGTLVHLQPPGLAPKPVQAANVSLDLTDFGDQATPQPAAPARTADAATPRAG